MFKLLYFYLNTLNALLHRRLLSSMQFIIPVAWVGAIGFPVYFVIYSETERLWLTLIGTVSAIFILIISYIPRFKTKYLPAFWYIYLIILLPFDFVYGLLTNSENVIYQLGAMLMLMSLTIIVSDAWMLITMLIIGIFGAILVEHVSIIQAAALLHLATLGPAYLLGLVFGVILMHKKSITEKNKLEGAMTLAHRISHEVNTPLAILSLASETLSMHMPSLLKTYQLAKQQQIEVPKLLPSSLKVLADLPGTLERECEAATSIISILLMNARDPHQFNKRYRVLSMHDCIEQALQRYAYNRHFTREKIHWQRADDFTFYGVKILMVHVLLNLIKNASRAILKAEKGEIEIYTKSDASYHYLYFKDNALGVEEKIVSKLFDSFYTTSSEGTGLGLYFCKQVIETFHGKIWCESVYGEYTTFIIRLPFYRNSE